MVRVIADVRLHVQIRPARGDEVEQLSALALAAKAHWGYSAETLNSWKELLQVTAADVASKHVVVGAIGDEIVGFYSLVPSTDSWKLDNLWVSPNFMDRGYGRQLLAHALESASRGGAHRVTVDADPNAESFYLTCGATRCGEVAAPIPGQPNRVRPQLAFDASAI
jgi:ribosomal protein S18 acetylase RimI-like enzyme